MCVSCVVLSGLCNYFSRYPLMLHSFPCVCLSSVAFSVPSQRIEVLRENQYKTWTFNKDTSGPVVLMMVVFPVIGYYFFKKEQVGLRVCLRPSPLCFRAPCVCIRVI